MGTEQAMEGDPITLIILAVAMLFAIISTHCGAAGLGFGSRA
jgi:hypothetical protein